MPSTAESRLKNLFDPLFSRLTPFPKVGVQQRHAEGDPIFRRRSVARDVPERFDETAHLLPADPENASRSEIERQYLVAGLPVEEQLRLRSDKPAVAELIGNKGLQDHGVRVFSATVPGKRDGILQQHAHQPLSRHKRYRRGRPHLPLALSGHGLACSRKYEGRSDSPDKTFSRMENGDI